MNFISAIILARSGSKGVPNKDLLNFSGKPLLAWSILQAREAKHINQVYVSSDSHAILKVAEEYGAIPIKLPDELSADTASLGGALLHALDAIKAQRGVEPEAVIFLRATSPLREPSDIDSAIRTFQSQSADSLFSDALLDDLCVWVEENGIHKGNIFDPWNRGQQQDRQPLYLENGSIYVFKPQLLREIGDCWGGKIARYTMPYWKSFEVDTPDNIDLCEYYFRKHLFPYWCAREPGIAAFKPDLIVYDFDGVMTDNRVLVLQDGTEGVIANRADGWGVSQLRQAGFRQIILSTETNPVVSARAKKLGVEVLQGSGDKPRDLIDYCRSIDVALERVLYVGNDVNDLEAMRLVGYPVAPADAHATVLALAKHVTQSRGGEGVIKEISELLLAQAGT